VVELLEAWCLKSIEEVISLKLWATQARQLSGAVVMEKARNEVREVGGEKFGAEKKAKKNPRKGKRMCFGPSPKRLERPHPKLVHWWLLVHSSRLVLILNHMILVNQMTIVLDYARDVAHYFFR